MGWEGQTGVLVSRDKDPERQGAQLPRAVGGDAQSGTLILGGLSLQ